MLRFGLVEVIHEKSDTRKKLPCHCLTEVFDERLIVPTRPRM